MLVRSLVFALATLLALAHPAAAQNISSASIDGVVTDATGGALPGVTVTITSPALQVSQLVQTTDGQGHYRFIDLPRGTYQLRFEIQGFDPLVRPGLEVNAGFAAPINVPVEAGALINVITKSGGNDYHGRYSDFYMRQPASNITSDLTARGLTVGTSLQYYNDLFADLGGRIQRDKIWFYGSMRDRRNKTSRPGLVLNPGPDGVYLTGDEPAVFPTSQLDNPTIKGSFQLTPKYQLVADYAREVTNSDSDYQKTIFAAQSTSNPDFTHIAFEATQVFRWVPTRWKFELKGTPTNHLLFDAQFGRSTYLLDYTPQSMCGVT